MCNRGVANLSRSENPVDSLLNHQGVYMMDSLVPTTTASGPAMGAGSSPGSNDDIPRVKFLCSFLGSIMPRPQDGKLRYVGGETRIVSLPRDITCAELMHRMRELYEGAEVLKYQQPDEDLDALVSVVNNDDVTNMMEEYEKLGSGDGFTRLRIFLFSHPEHEGSALYVDGDDRDTERRYVDALNDMNDASDFKKPPHPESPGMSPIDDLHATEEFLNLHNLNIPPHMVSGQLQQLVSQRYSEMEAPWSPAYYSPRHHGQIDPRLADIPNSPSSARLHMPFGEYQDKMTDEYARHLVNHQAIPAYEHRPQFSDNVVWLPPGTILGDNSGFPGNILHDSNLFEGNSVCEHCRVTFQRNQSQLEQSNIANGLHSLSNQCNGCPPNNENFMLNGDAKMHHGIYPKEQSDPRAVYGTPNHERGRVMQHQLNPLVAEARTHVSGVGRFNDYIAEGQHMNFPPGHANTADAHQMPSNYNHHRPGPELSTDVLHDQVMAAAPHMHIPPEEHGVRFGNVPPYPCGAENVYPASCGPVPGHIRWRNAQSPGHGSPSFEASTVVQHLNSSGSPRFFIGEESQNPWIESSPKMIGFDEVTPPEYSYGLKLNPNTLTQEKPHLYSPGPIQPQPDRLNIITNMPPLPLLDSSSTHDKLISAVTGHNPEPMKSTNITEAARVELNNNQGEVGKRHVEKVEISSSHSISCPDTKIIADNKDGVPVIGSVAPNYFVPIEEKVDSVKPTEKDLHAAVEDSEQLVNHVMPELIASMKKVALEGIKEVKAKAEGSAGSGTKEMTANELEPVNANGDSEMGSENDNVNTSEIEPTKAEAEAIARGLQTIKNDDLEEIRELGSGTYGAVYHGKWKGSDVAIKRIKASCFAGRPSHRERLIADFWKEALILSSLHHPNVVSFYGIVRDGPDGSLATLTEFMVNGSLKQFLQKKDRTIDRRKRLIIAMDAAFGMEYLHGKNIVHFDLKCENLLVNMRDPQRPVCKIGDLGLSKVKQHTLVSGGVRGTLPWMAPELLSGTCSMVTEKIDVYSFGIVMWELLTGDEPYADMRCAAIIGGIVNNTLRPQIPTWCDPEWKNLMQSCWASDPAERPSFSEISEKLRTMAAAINVK